MTTRDTISDRPESWNGASVFNARGQRVNELDLDERRHGQTTDEMTDADWQNAAEALREFDEVRS